MKFDLKVLQQRLEDGFIFDSKGTNIGGMSSIKGIVNQNAKVLIFKKEDGSIFDMEYVDANKEGIMNLLKEYGQVIDLNE